MSVRAYDPSDDVEALRRELERLRARERELIGELESIEARAAAAETASQAREELLAIVSHDLRNPLGSILTSNAMIARLDVAPPHGDKLKKYSAIIQRSADRMNRWISDLLELALLESGTLSIIRAPVEARALVKDAFDTFTPLAAEKEIRLDCDVLTDPGVLHADRDRILQVLSNLLGNALKYTPPGGEVKIIADEVDGVPTFSVRDTGPGIAPAQVPKIFDRYWQARRQRGAGVGLGLSIAKGLVEAHGGTLRVETAPGAGASFLFTIPRAS
jgi:signal transduction histidine kinase